MKIVAHSDHAGIEIRLHSTDRIPRGNGGSIALEAGTG